LITSAAPEKEAAIILEGNNTRLRHEGAVFDGYGAFFG